MDSETDDDIEILEVLPDQETPPPDLRPLGAIPVLLEFEVGRLTVPVGQLEQWRPGTIVELEPPRMDEAVEVTIRANGLAVGSGDLVRVGERLAVRVARIARPAAIESAEADVPE